MNTQCNKAPVSKMSVVVAVDSFKGSCTAQQACAAIAKGLTRYSQDVIVHQLPIADGGEGLLQILNASPQLKRKMYRHLTVIGPYQQPITANYLMLDDNRTIIEMAQACGLELTPEPQRNSPDATSYGLGQLVKQALDDGSRYIIIGLGGSATNDGGIGFAQALGVVFYDSQNQPLPTPACGKHLASIARIDASGLHPAVNHTTFEASCDVNNPLLGRNGATWIYGSQKGATVKQLTALEEGMANYHKVISQALSRDVNAIPGAGAAGGMGAALLWFTNAQLRPGIELVLDLLNAESLICQADLVITGEGKLDKQSSFGKAPVGVANLAAKLGKPTVALCGTIGDGAHILYQHNIRAMWSICPRPISLDSAIQEVEMLLTDAAESLIRTINVGVEISKR